MPPLAWGALAGADWSLAAKKRWIAIAHRAPDATWSAEPPRPVGPLAALLPTLTAIAGARPALLGVDAPLGVPRAWADRAHVPSFRALLRLAERDPAWSAFYEVCERPDEIRLTRPFYPRRPGGTRRAHLIDGLGLSDAAALYRRCDRPTNPRANPAALFWTMGANQVGKATITLWRDALSPALHRPNDRLDAPHLSPRERSHIEAHHETADRSTALSLWPMDGTLAALSRRSGVTVAEVYPGEVYGWFGADFGGMSKRNQAARRRAAPALAAALGTIATPALLDAIVDGFGDGADGEDRFDAVVALAGVWLVATGRRALYEPGGRVLREIEGWVLGRGPE